MTKSPAIEDADTTWFNIDLYEKFNYMRPAEWIWQLEVRAYYRGLLQKKLAPHKAKRPRKSPKFPASESPKSHTPLKLDDPLSSLVKALSMSGVIKRPWDLEPIDTLTESISAAQLARYPFSTASVDSLKSYEMWSMTNNTLKTVLDACSYEQDYSWGNPNDIGNTPIDFHIKQDDYFDSGRIAHVTINLSATDKQIQKDFEHWLTHYRTEIKYPSEIRLFDQTQTKLQNLFLSKVIPYLDLLLVAKIRGQKKIPLNELGALLFPDDPSGSAPDHVRTVIKPLADKIISKELHKTLSTQLVHENIMRKNANKCKLKCKLKCKEECKKLGGVNFKDISPENIMRKNANKCKLQCKLKCKEKCKKLGDINFNDTSSQLAQKTQIC